MGLHPPPQEDPQPQHQPRHHREHDGHQQVHKEGEEGPGHEGDDHDDDDDHGGAEPGEEEVPAVQHGAQEEEEGEEEVEDPGDDDTAEEGLVVAVQPGEALDDGHGHLEEAEGELEGAVITLVSQWLLSNQRCTALLSPCQEWMLTSSRTQGRDSAREESSDSTPVNSTTPRPG